jgi:cytochrome c oxidase subunit II
VTISPPASAFDAVMRKILFLPEPASTIAEEIDHLHFQIWIVTTLVAVAILTLGGWFAFKYRRRAGVQRTELGPPPRLWFELGIYLVPLTVFVAWFVVGFQSAVKLQEPPADAMNVYVVGKQWMWEFAYEGGPSAIGTLRVPAHRPVRLFLTSRDVVHSFYVPELRVKEDAPVAHTNQIWFEATRVGTFDIFCTEYCGTGHSVMRGKLQIMEPLEFDRWIAEQRRGLALRQDSGGPLDPLGSATLTMAQEGKRASEELRCFKCHSIDGRRGIGPSWKGLYRSHEKLSDGREVTVDDAYLTRSMFDPMADLVMGYASAMPTYQGTMTGPQAAAIVEYIKSLQDDRLAQTASPGPIP